jgi:glutamate formiminotransferase
MQATETLLAVPNFSEGRSAEVIDQIGAALAQPAGVRVLDIHSDPDHNRSVFTLAGSAMELLDALLGGAKRACELIDLRREGAQAGVHPHVGALDVAPLVYPRAELRGLACAAALVLADRLGDQLELPVFLYGELAGGRTRAQLRAGGLSALIERAASGQIAPDFGPAQIEPARGASLVGARPPLVAFNIVLPASVGIERARALARRLREGGERGLPGVRALALSLPSRGLLQLSFNIEEPARVPLLRVLEAVRGEVEVLGCELIGLAPECALEGFPVALLSPSFDRSRSLLEAALAGAKATP